MTASSPAGFPVAQRVVYRDPRRHTHTNQPPDPSEERCRFDVDGAPFPWYITGDGAQFAKSSSGLYLASVGIIPLEIGGDEITDVTLSYRTPPRIGGRVFPWAILDGSVRAVFDGSLPVLHVTFIAGELDTDSGITTETAGNDAHHDD